MTSSPTCSTSATTGRTYAPSPPGVSIPWINWASSPPIRCRTSAGVTCPTSTGVGGTPTTVSHPNRNGRLICSPTYGRSFRGGVHANADSTTTGSRRYDALCTFSRTCLCTPACTPTALVLAVQAVPAGVAWIDGDTGKGMPLANRPCLGAPTSCPGRVERLRGAALFAPGAGAWSLLRQAPAIYPDDSSAADRCTN
jgi:hypothetical protein